MSDEGGARAAEEEPLDPGQAPGADDQEVRGGLARRDRQLVARGAVGRAGLGGQAVLAQPPGRICGDRLGRCWASRRSSRWAACTWATIVGATPETKGATVS